MTSSTEVMDERVREGGRDNFERRVGKSSTSRCSRLDEVWRKVDLTKDDDDDDDVDISLINVG